MAKLLYSFEFSNGYIFEVERPGKNLEKSKRFQWYILFDGTTKCLDFKSMTENTRSFKDGTFLDMKKCALTFNGTQYMVKSCEFI